MPVRVEVLERQRLHDGFISVERLRLRHALFGGGLSDVLIREVYANRRGVGVLPYDPQHDAVILVEQFRIGALDMPSGPWLIELIAGMVEPGETDEVVAHRESAEEADCRLDVLWPICEYVSTPGVSAETVQLYCARTDSAGLGGIHGEPKEGEDIRVHVVSMGEALEMMSNGVIQSAMPIIALQWMALNRQRIRDAWL
ncbi:NUDIX domain-containing protein [Ectothiorhodospiraceae bacterium WFHF3C12]|nr:NUDIX domain-containing protein [Ectothiorhodospiraceae bacterium WFHF3C12]